MDDKKVFIDIEAKTEVAISNLAELTRQIKATQDNVSNLNKQWKEQQKRLDDANKAVNQYTKQIKDTDGNIKTIVTDEKAYHEAISERSAILQQVSAFEVEYSQRIVEEKLNLQSLSEEYKNTNKEVVNLEKAQSDSLEGMRSKLSLMIKEYDNLSKTERESAKGTELQQHILELNTNLTTLEESTGRFQRNVGNYKSAFDGLGESFKNIGVNILNVGTQSKTAIGGLKAMQTAAQAGIKTILSGLKSILANPIGLAIAAIVVAVKSLVSIFKEAFSRSDEAGTALQELLTALKVPLNIIIGLVTKLVTILAPAITGIANFISGAWGGVAEFLGLVDKGFTERVKNLEHKKDEIADLERKIETNHAEHQAKIQDLNTDAMDSENTDFESRKKLLKQSLELYNTDYQARKELLLKKLKIAEDEAKLNNDTSDETSKAIEVIKQSLAELDRESSQFQKTYNRNLKQINNQASSYAREQKQKLEELIKLIRTLKNENTDLMTSLLSDSYYKKELELTNNYKKELQSIEDEIKKNNNPEVLRQLNEKKVNIQQKYNKDMAILAKERLGDIKTLNEEISDLNNQSIEDELERENAEYNAIQNRLANENNRLIAESENIKQEIINSELRAKELKSIEELSLEDKRELDRKIEDSTIEFNLKIDKNDKQFELNKKNHNNRVKEIESQRLQIYLDSMEKEVQSLIDSYDITERLDKAIESGDEDSVRKLLENRDFLIKELDNKKSELQSKLFSLNPESDEYRLVEQRIKSIDDSILGLQENSAKALEDAARVATEIVTETISSIGSIYESVGGLINGITELFSMEKESAIEALDAEKEKYGEVSEYKKQQALKAAEVNYHATMAGIILNQGAGIADATVMAIKAAKDTTGGAVARIAAMTAAITAGLSALLSGIAQAKQASQAYEEEKSQINAYATGGYVRGAGTGTSDSIPARLSNGEFVVNARQTSQYLPLLEAINGGFGDMFSRRYATGGLVRDYDTLSTIMRDAVLSFQPIVSVREITRVQNRVKVKESINQ